LRVNYHAASDARAGLLAMLQPEIVGKMLTAMQQQSEARQAQAKKEAAEIAANGEPVNPVNDGQNRKSNVLNIGMGFKGADGLGECIQFLRNTFDVETEGLEMTIQWQGLLDFQFDHTVAKEHVFSFQFTARVKEQLEIAARKKTARTR
jgi:ethanolamine ammonia-lyase small subunit